MSKLLKAFKSDSDGGTVEYYYETDYDTDDPEIIRKGEKKKYESNLILNNASEGKRRLRNIKNIMKMYVQKTLIIRITLLKITQQCMRTKLKGVTRTTATSFTSH